MVGVVLYVLVDVVLQFLPPHYSPISDAESNLAVGPYGWIMNLNFVGRMITSLAAAAALAMLGGGGTLRRVGLWLFALGGLCSGVLAFFPTDIQEAGVPGLHPVTTVGAVHLTVATIGFVAALAGIGILTVWLSISPVLATARRPALVFTGVGAAGLAFLALTITALPDLLGLAERVCLLGILGWVFGVCRVIATTRTLTHPLPELAISPR
jgi:hypothetical membrane protein